MMNYRQNGGPAFPTNPEEVWNGDTDQKIGEIKGQNGMTLRDYFAACFVKGALSNSTIKITAPGDSASHIAKSAYIFADAMLTEREK